MSDQGKTSTNSKLVEKYEEAAEKFESLAEAFTGEDGDLNVLFRFQGCVSSLETLVALETDPSLEQVVRNVLNTNKWQLSQLCESYSLRTPSAQGDLISESSKKSERAADSGRQISRREVIKSTQRPLSNETLKDIYGLENVKSLLWKSVFLPLQFPELFKDGRRSWTQILLYGPPGTGKSKIAVAIANEAKIPLFSISSADLLSSWVGESEKMVKELFEYTRALQGKSIVFIDEIDSICRKRTQREGDHTRSMKNQLLIELDRNMSLESNCFLLCATNAPWDIDTAFMRRFQCKIFVPLPNRESRQQILQSKCGGVGIDMSPGDWEEVAAQTEGYSGSDLTNVAHFAILEPMGALQNNESWILTPAGKCVPSPPEQSNSFKAPLSTIPPGKVSVRNVNLKDFLKAVSLIKKTVSESEIDKYKKYNSENSQDQTTM